MSKFFLANNPTPEAFAAKVRTYWYRGLITLEDIDAIRDAAADQAILAEGAEAERLDGIVTAASVLIAEIRAEVA